MEHEAMKEIVPILNPGKVLSWRLPCPYIQQVIKFWLRLSRLNYLFILLNSICMDTGIVTEVYSATNISNNMIGNKILFKVFTLECCSKTFRIV